jgi:hypothetical protein
MEVYMAANSHYRDSVFSILFNDPEALRGLYSALEGVPVDPSIPVSINTLSDALYMERYNDISFTIGNTLVVLVEHQSTINLNMPLRFLFYISRIYEKIIDQNKTGSIYREKRIKIPFPEFLVLYNGVKPYPSREILKLSDAFEDIKALKGIDIFPKLDVIVKVYNINKGYNDDIVNKCEKLQDYSTFVAQVRENSKAMTLDNAIKNAIDYCIEHNILSKFLLEHSSEVRNMLFTEWNWDDAKQVWQEEAREDGREEGVIAVAKKALYKGMSISDVQDITGLDIEVIESLPTKED